MALGPIPRHNCLQQAYAGGFALLFVPPANADTHRPTFVRKSPMPPADALFAIANPIPLPFWLLLAVAPRWKYTLPLVRLVVVPLIALAYAVLVVTKFGSADGDFNSLAGVQQLFANPYTLLAGWLHYLAFDLFVGAWIVEDALSRGVPAWARIVPLPLTLMFGPAGLLLYLILRQLTANTVHSPARTGAVLGTGAA